MFRNSLPSPISHASFLSAPGLSALLLTLASMPSPGATQSPEPADNHTAIPAEIRRTVASFHPDRVLYETPGEGLLWARGDRYKARFAPGDTQYIPFLGSTAPRNFPLAMHVVHASISGAEMAFDAQAAPTRSGDRVSYDRGTFIERYDLALESMEQSFVFDTLPARGELVVRIAAESELAAHETDAALEFSNDLGSVRYGRATVIDAAGVSISAATTLTAQGIEIRVPAQFVERAELPLTIDPLVSTFGVTGNQLNETQGADVAYDAASTRYACVYQTAFSAADHDIWLALLSSTGVLQGVDVVDTSTENWEHPKVANNAVAHQFLVVAEVGPSNGARQIRGKTVLAADGSLGAAIAISGNAPGDNRHPDVGGDPYPNPPTHYAVVWENEAVVGNTDVFARLVNADGSLVGAGTTCLDCSLSVDTAPSISKSNQASDWNIAWQRQVTLTDHDIVGARLHWNGTISAQPFTIDSSNNEDTEPTACTSLRFGDRWLVAFQRDNGTEHDIVCWSITGSTPSGFAFPTLEEFYNGSTTPGEDQIHPRGDSDGQSFVIAYEESVDGSSTDHDVYALTIGLLGAQPRLSEGHRLISIGTGDENHPAIASCQGAGGPETRFVTAYADTHAQFAAVNGGLFDASPFTSFCVPTFDATPCPCGNSASAYGQGCNNSSNTGGARLEASGIASLSNDSVHFDTTGEKPTALSIFGQGNALVSNGVAFGQGVRCAGGTLKRLYSKVAVGGSAVAPSGADPSVSARSAMLGDPITAGSVRYYYVYYRDPNVLPGCSATSTFNSTQTIQTVWSH